MPNTRPNPLILKQVLLLERWMNLMLALHARDADVERAGAEDIDRPRRGDSAHIRYDGGDSNAPLLAEDYPETCTAGISRHHPLLQSSSSGVGVDAGTDTGGKGIAISPALPHFRKKGSAGDAVDVDGTTAAEFDLEGALPTADQRCRSAQFEGLGSQQLGGEERKAAKIRAQMNVLMVGLFEIIRQVRAATV